jgi:thermolabile hemolysin
MEKTKIKLLLALLFLSVCVTAVHAGPFDQIVVFGDSLSDTGNLVFIEDQPRPEPDLYWEGRFSNGPVWVEYLAAPERLDAPLKNRAFGGAETSSLTPPGLVQQVVLYAADADPFSPDTLFVVWIGGNDHLNSGRTAPSAVNHIEDALEGLARIGARHLLVLNLPDLGAIPDFRDAPVEAAQATAFTLEFNAALDNMLAAFSPAHPQVALYVFDAYGLSLAVSNDPAAFGFANATDPSPNFGQNFERTGYVFWDDKHPTTEMHALLADRVSASLNESAGGDSVISADSSSCFIGAATGGL